MPNTMEELYWVVREQVDSDPEYRKKQHALSVATLAVVEELETLCGEKYVALLDVMGGLDDSAREQHEKALFRAALQMGMQLGRMSVS